MWNLFFIPNYSVICTTRAILIKLVHLNLPHINPNRISLQHQTCFIFKCDVDCWLFASENFTWLKTVDLSKIWIFYIYFFIQEAEVTRVTRVTDDHLQEAGPSGWSLSKGQLLQMIICKRPDPSDDHLQESGPPSDHLQKAGSSRRSFAKGQILRMIICKRSAPRRLYTRSSRTWKLRYTGSKKAHHHRLCGRDNYQLWGPGVKKCPLAGS